MDKTDRELLEAAAKAAGYVIESFTADGGCWAYVAGVPMNSDGEPPIFKWHPRDDDGDALRLAVRLDIWVHPGDGQEIVEVVGVRAIRQSAGDDRNAATRRLIVWAAASIGGSNE